MHKSEQKDDFISRLQLAVITILSSVCLFVCPWGNSVALTVSVSSWQLYRHVPRRGLPVHFFRHFCCRMYIAHKWQKAGGGEDTRSRLQFKTVSKCSCCPQLFQTMVCYAERSAVTATAEPEKNCAMYNVPITSDCEEKFPLLKLNFLWYLSHKGIYNYTCKRPLCNYTACTVYLLLLHNSCCHHQPRRNWIISALVVRWLAVGLVMGRSLVRLPAGALSSQLGQLSLPSLRGR